MFDMSMTKEDCEKMYPWLEYIKELDNDGEIKSFLPNTPKEILDTYNNHLKEIERCTKNGIWIQK